MTKHQIKTLDTIRLMNGLYIGFSNDRTIKTLIAKGYIKFYPTAHGAGYCAIKLY